MAEPRPLSSPASSAPRIDEPSHPRTTAATHDWRRGAVFRDRFDRSLVVITATAGCAQVEYADGRVESLDEQHWRALRPTPATF